MQNKIICVVSKNEANAEVVTCGEIDGETGTRTLFLNRISVAGISPDQLTDTYARIVYADGCYKIGEIYEVPQVGTVQQ